MFSYPVRLAPDDNGTVLATFPDVPEAVTFGDDEDDALLHAVDALLTALAHRIDERQEIPSPSRPGRGEPSVDLPPLAAAKVALYRTMREQGVSKAALARRMDIQAPQIDRLLDLYQTSRLEQVTRALAALGKRLAIEVSNAA
jgi:antitoxin HicB